jgi:hypothetical protein
MASPRVATALSVSECVCTEDTVLLELVSCAARRLFLCVLLLALLALLARRWPDSLRPSDLRASAAR